MSRLTRGLAGAGAALEEVGMRGYQSALDEEKTARLAALQNQFQTARDERQEGYAVGREQRGQEFQRGERELDRTQARELQSAGFTHAENLQGNQQQFLRGENKAGRELQLQLAQEHEKAADARHRSSIGVQMAQLKALQEGVSLVPAADGTIHKITKDGRNMGVLADQSGNAISGPKDVSATVKMMVEANNKYMEALNRDLKDAMGPEKQTLMAQIHEVRADTQRLLGMSTGAAPKAGSGERPPLDAFFGGGQSGQPGQRAATKPPTTRPGYAGAMDEASPRRPRGLVEQAMTPDDQMLYP